MHVRKLHAGSAGPYTWETDGAVLDVPDVFGEELLAIPGAGFYEVAPHQIASEAEMNKGGMTASEAASVISPEDRLRLADDEKAALESDAKAAAEAADALVKARAYEHEKAQEAAEEEARENDRKAEDSDAEKAEQDEKDKAPKTDAADRLASLERDAGAERTADLPSGATEHAADPVSDGAAEGNEVPQQEPTPAPTPAQKAAATRAANKAQASPAGVTAESAPDTSGVKE